MKNLFATSLLLGTVVGSDNVSLPTKSQPHKISAAMQPLRPRTLEGAGNIVLPIEPDDALCDIDVMNQRSFKEEDLSNADVEFWYAIGTSQFVKKDRILFELNQWIYKSMLETNVWCAPMFNNETQSTTPLGVVTFVPTGSSTTEDRTY
jgi:hypothetical protein